MKKHGLSVEDSKIYIYIKRLLRENNGWDHLYQMKKKMNQVSREIPKTMKKFCDSPAKDIPSIFSFRGFSEKFKSFELGLDPNHFGLGQVRDKFHV